MPAATLAFDILSFLVLIAAVFLTPSEGPDDEFMSTSFFVLGAVGIGGAALLFVVQVIALLVWGSRWLGRQRGESRPGNSAVIDSRRPWYRRLVWLGSLAPLALDGLYALLIMTIAQRVERPPFTDGELFGLGLLYLLWTTDGVILLTTQVVALLVWSLVWFVHHRRAFAPV
ncbi:MAG: hypothetical protein AVDCRST_MAG88-1006 [uncultured Thermomicrobiales bacterium]|uniref:Uncharacterized protein n=1 Tax=uncultured Thermomicrobiales bacterium TaxID=1645740 RepID=A0A6J4UQ11_9BACT|nr:MAG: hypothetical protein AVDCRST_MAG88-1006 [uncultured Thermomicrobiales bacterium]